MWIFFCLGNVIAVKVQVIALCWHNYYDCQLCSVCLFSLAGMIIKDRSAGIFGFPHGLKNQKFKNIFSLTGNLNIFDRQSLENKAGI